MGGTSNQHHNLIREFETSSHPALDTLSKVLILQVAAVRVHYIQIKLKNKKTLQLLGKCSRVKRTTVAP